MRSPTFVLFAFFLAAISISESSLYAQARGGQKDPEKRTQKQQSGGGGKRAAIELPEGNLVLGAPGPTYISGNIYLKEGSSAYLEYGASPKESKKTNLIRADRSGPVAFRIEGLNASTQYFYRLHLKPSNSSSFTESGTSYFTTARRSGSVFSFTVQGDSHPERAGKMFSADLYRKTLDSLSVLKPDFHFLMGDDFSLDRLLANQQVNQPNVDQAYQLQRSYLGRVGSNPPYFLVNGNHEQASRYFLDGSDTNVAVLAARARNRFFAQPSPDRFFTGDTVLVPQIGELHDYYSFEWGDALFVVIDPYWHSEVLVDHAPGQEGKTQKKDPWGITLGEVQYQWFKKTLEMSRARYKFVFSHHVSGTGRGGVERANFFEWGGQAQKGSWQFDRNRPNWSLPIHQLMVKNRVTIFFQGHDHLFARQEKDGVIYQSVPNPADNTYTAFNREAYTSGDILPNSGFLQIEVSPQKLTVNYHRTFLPTDSLSTENQKGFQYIIPYNSKNK